MCTGGLIILISFLVAAFCAGIVIPQILLIAFRCNLFDEPDERKIHHSLVPRLGGIAFKPVVFFTVALMIAININLGNEEVISLLSQEGSTLLYGFCSVMVLYLIGMADDLVGVKYRVKFVVQILCAILVICGGVSLDNFNGVFGLYDIPAWFGYPFTVLLIVFIINAINLIDGIDGLASGLCSVAFAVYGVIFFLLGEYIYSMLAFANLGVLVPFFYYNVFGNADKHKKIFMGDTGSLTIGMMICFLCLRLVQMVPENGVIVEKAMVLGFSPLLIPCLDVVRVYLRRVRNGKNPFLPDKTHIHHKLLAIGMRHNWAMITILGCSVCLTLFNVVLDDYVNINIVFIIDAVVWISANVYLSRRIRQIKSQLNLAKQKQNKN